MSKAKTWLAALLLCVPVLLATSCVHREDPPPPETGTPDFFVWIFEDEAVRQLRHHGHPQDRDAFLATCKGWRKRTDEAWQYLRTTVDDICVEHDLGTFTDEEVGLVLTAAYGGDDYLRMVLFDHMDEFRQSYRRRAIVMGLFILKIDRSHRGWVRDVG